METSDYNRIPSKFSLAMDTMLVISVLSIGVHIATADDVGMTGLFIAAVMAIGGFRAGHLYAERSNKKGGAHDRAQ